MNAGPQADRGKENLMAFYEKTLHISGNRSNYYFYGAHVPAGEIEFCYMSIYTIRQIIDLVMTDPIGINEAHGWNKITNLDEKRAELAHGSIDPIFLHWYITDFNGAAFLAEWTNAQIYKNDMLGVYAAGVDGAACIIPIKFWETEEQAERAAQLQASHVLSSEEAGSYLI